MQFIFRRTSRCAFLICTVLLALSTTFCLLSPAAAGIVSVTNGDVAWGDYDSDGDLDLLITGLGTSGPVTYLYRNEDGAAFTEMPISLPALAYSSAAWGDYDGDGHLDIAIMGEGSDTHHRTLLLHGDGSAFTETDNILLGLASGGIQWIDYGNDGDLDLAIYGQQETSGNVLKIYRNDGGKFTEIYSLAGTQGSFDVSFGDFTGDGRTDFVVNGQNLFRNTGSGFESGLLSQNYAGVSAGSDYDGDGRLDLAVAGSHLVLLHNLGLGVLRPNLPIENFGFSTPGYKVAWGDCDSDGDADIFALVHMVSYTLLKVYRHDSGGVFQWINSYSDASSWGDVALGDLDGDGDVDIATLIGVFRNDPGGLLRMGTVGYAVPSSKSAASGAGLRPGPYTVQGAQPAPTGLTAVVEGSDVLLTWNAGSGATPSLSYGIRVGTAPGASDIYSGLARADGTRLLPAIGDAWYGRSWRLVLPVGKYYWSVQAVDNAFRGSPWSAESSFDVAPVPIGQALRLADRSALMTEDSVVTAVFGNLCYVEAEDRSHGIMAAGSTPPGVTVGQKVRVMGTMMTDANTTERYIKPDSIVDRGTGTIRPIGMQIKALGGATYGNQSGISDAAGLNNIGLLVTVTGKFVPSTGWGSPAVEDGTGERVKCVLASGMTYNSNWLYVQATGISSCFKDTDGKTRRQLKIRDASSILVIEGVPASISGKVFNTGGQYQQTPYTVQSPHPVPMYYTCTWPITGPAGAMRIRVHFSRLSLGTREQLYVWDGADHLLAYYYGGDWPDGRWSPWATGNCIELYMVYGTFYSGAWGFATDVYECEFDNPLPGTMLNVQPGNLNVVAGEDGRFALPTLPAGTYTITPSYPDAIFDPPSAVITVDCGQTVTDLNFTRQ